MSAIGLRHLLPRSILAGRWLVVLVCYLDDSGKDSQNQVVSLGGYAASEEAWEAFEREAEPIFQKYIGDEPLHAMDLHHRKGRFKGWKVIQKQSFVAQLCMKLYPLRPVIGLGYAVRKANYGALLAEAQERGRKAEDMLPTAHTYCMENIVNCILRNIHVGKVANEDGLALILESGNEHNNEAKISFDRIREVHKLDCLKSLSFVPKTACRAIQMADLFAFYYRREARRFEIAREAGKIDPVFKVLCEGLNGVGSLMTKFSYDPKARHQNWAK